MGPLSDELYTTKESSTTLFKQLYLKLKDTCQIVILPLEVNVSNEYYVRRTLKWIKGIFFALWFDCDLTLHQDPKTSCSFDHRIVRIMTEALSNQTQNVVCDCAKWKLNSASISGEKLSQQNRINI